MNFGPEKVIFKPFPLGWGEKYGAPWEKFPSGPWEGLDPKWPFLFTWYVMYIFGKNRIGN